MNKEYLAARRWGGTTRQIPDRSAKLVTIVGGIANTRNTLSSGEQDSSLVNDFTTREKITHFDHETIPELIVHGRASISQYIGAAKQQRVRDREALLSGDQK